MTTKNNPGSNAYHDMKCIWMSSKVIDYKLCDKNFECERCAFDKVMRNVSIEPADLVLDEDYPVNVIINNIMDKVQREKYENKVIYLRNHLMLKHLFGNTYYLGLNPVVLGFLDNINEVEETDKNDYILKDQSIFRLKGDWGSVELSSPLSFMLMEKMNYSPEKLAANQWFAIIGVTPIEINNSRISYFDWLERQTGTINMLSNFKIKAPCIGPTMNDGGDEVKYLYQLIGKVEYLKALEKFFSN